MNILLENLLTYLVVGFFVVLTLYIYLRIKNKGSAATQQKIEKAKELGFHEPVSLHPVVSHDMCIGSGACIAACPEKDILGIVSSQAVTINASRCVGHGACFHACPVQAISLVMGTEERGVELPHVSQKYETNVPGIFIAGELGGMGLIKNAVEQGKQAIENIIASLPSNHSSEFDVIIIGAGPAGIGASLLAKMNGLNFKTLEQDTIGGTVFSFPRKKIVMTSPMDLPLHGKVKFVETNKTELIELWHEVLGKNGITVNENEKVNSITREKNGFNIFTNKGNYTTAKVLLAIGRRGSPRKLGVPGEISEKVAYRLLEPELIQNQNVLVVGGGDSAVESAMLLVDEGKNNNVYLSYRGDSFKRIKEKNSEKINAFAESGKIKLLLNSTVKEINSDSVILIYNNDEIKIENDLVYVFAGGELPNAFLESAGIHITKKFGEVVLKH